jgi:hypothetical protein
VDVTVGGERSYEGRLGKDRSPGEYALRDQAKTRAKKVSRCSRVFDSLLTSGDKAAKHGSLAGYRQKVASQYTARVKACLAAMQISSATCPRKGRQKYGNISAGAQIALWHLARQLGGP